MYMYVYSMRPMYLYNNGDKNIATCHEFVEIFRKELHKNYKNEIKNYHNTQISMATTYHENCVDETAKRR